MRIIYLPFIPLDHLVFEEFNEYVRYEVLGWQNADLATYMAGSNSSGFSCLVPFNLYVVTLHNRKKVCQRCLRPVCGCKELM